MRTSALLPSLQTSARLFGFGSTLGPVVDSLHNQCLLRYDVAPIALSFPDTETSFFCSSWTVFPLLGIAYVVLGGILPRLFQIGVTSLALGTNALSSSSSSSSSSSEDKPTISWQGDARTKAIVAVATTAMIIKLSEILETHDYFDSSTNLMIMLVAALTQWIALDGTLVALLAATVTSIGGPLSELPFVAHGFWHYLPQAGDYLPLATVQWEILKYFLGDNYQNLALSSITGPCYFAVTMDAIALGRWFDSTTPATPLATTEAE